MRVRVHSGLGILEQLHKNVENMANINGKTIFINLELLPGNQEHKITTATKKEESGYEYPVCPLRQQICKKQE